MSGRHRKSSTIAKQKQALKAGAVTAPLAVGIMLGAATNASADEASTDIAPAAGANGDGLAQYPNSWMQSGGAFTHDQINKIMLQQFPGITPEDPLAKPLSVPKPEIFDNPDNLQSAGGELDEIASFPRIVGPDHFGNYMQKEATLYSVNTKTTEGLMKQAWKDGVKGGGRIGLEFKTPGEGLLGGIGVHPEVSGEYTHETSTESAPPENTYAYSKGHEETFNPGSRGAHQALVFPYAKYDDKYLQVNRGTVGEDGNTYEDVVDLDHEPGSYIVGKKDGRSDPVHFVEQPVPSNDIEEVKEAPNVTNPDLRPENSVKSHLTTLSGMPRGAPSDESLNKKNLTFDGANPYSPRYDHRVDWPWDGQDSGYNYATGKYDQGSYAQWSTAHRKNFHYYGDEANPYHPDYQGRKGLDMGGYVFDRTHYNYEAKQYDEGSYWDWRRAHPELYPSDND